MAGSIVLRGLQVGVDHVVHGVQLIGNLSGISRRRRGGYVGVDGALPIADPCEGVGWHVQSVRRGRGNLSIALRSCDGSPGEWRHIVGVDDVVSQARMIWIFRE